MTGRARWWRYLAAQRRLQQRWGWVQRLWPSTELYLDRKGAPQYSQAVSTGRRLKPVHPGEVVLKDFIEPMELTRYKVAKNTGVPQRRIDEICAGNRAMSADTALRLGRFFGMDPQTWMNLQAQYDLEVAERESYKRIEREVTPLQKAV